MRFLNWSEYRQGWEAGYAQVAEDAATKPFPARLPCWQNGNYRRGLEKGYQDGVRANNPPESTNRKKKSQ